MLLIRFIKVSGKLLIVAFEQGPRHGHQNTAVNVVWTRRRQKKGTSTITTEAETGQIRTFKISEKLL